MTTAPPNGIGFTVFASEPAIVAEVRETLRRAWAQAARCEDCGAESGEPCRWPCISRPEDAEPIARVYRNMPEDSKPVPHGQVPAWTVGRWFVYCDECGHVGTAMMYGNPESAQRVADRHLELHGL